MNDGDLARLKKEKMERLQKQMEANEEQMSNSMTMEMQKQAILKKVLTPEAKSRLTNIKLANPEFAQNVEQLVLYLYSSGKVSKINDEQLRLILHKIKGKKRETKIIRK